MFARKRQQIEAGEIPPDPPEPAAAPAITGPAAKLMSMLGLSPEALERTAAEVKAMVEDFRQRLDRIEQKVDALDLTSRPVPPRVLEEKARRNGG